MTDDREAGRSPRTRLLYALGALGVVAGLVMAFVLPAVGDDGWSRDAKSAESVASDFVVSFNTYDAADLDDYRERVGELVTDEFEQTFLDQLAGAEESLVASQVVFAGATVTSTGVTQMDADSASVVVTFTFTVSAPTTQPSVVASRVIVSLSRSGDDGWVTSDLTEIPQVEAGVGAPDASAPAPEATP